MLTGGMESPCVRHITTRRRDGKVLVTGELSGTGDLSTAESFDAVTGIFTSAGNMETEHFLQTATLLRNGAVLVTGENNTAPVMRDCDPRIRLQTETLD